MFQVWYIIMFFQAEDGIQDSVASRGLGDVYKRLVSVFIGIVSGYLGGKFDMVMQRFVDAWMSFPDLIILIVVVAVVGVATVLTVKA